MKNRSAILIILLSVVFTYCSQVNDPIMNEENQATTSNTTGRLNKNIGAFIAPSNLTATINGNTVTISWTASPAVSGTSPATYHIVFEKGNLSARSNYAGTSMILENLAPGEYSFKVKAEDARDQDNNIISASEFTSNVSFTVGGGNSVDNTPPVIALSYSPLPNSYGWNNSNVTVTYSAYDESGLSASTPASGSFTFSSEGANQTHSFTVTDVKGNSSTATATVNIDKTKPDVSLSILGGTWFDGYLILGSSLTLNTTATDNLSGINHVNTNGTSGNSAVWTPASTGNYTVQANATDNADNSGSASKSLSVAYKFNGWRPPVSNSKSFKSGSTLPVKFLVVDANGKPVIEGVNVLVTVGGQSANAVLDDASTGQYKAEVKLSGSGTQTVSLEGNITPASLSITVK